MRSIIIGTAGHIDHGKTTLVRALTGVDADRLPEEKRRGITIDIGFAELDLGDARIGFVDVPGHERFVKNMLAGAHGIDAVALVIAADEGVMPQTREHFAVCRLLGVRDGLVVLTKIDTVDDELLPLVRAEAEELVAGSFLEQLPVVEVSARSGAGLEAMREQLRQLAQRIPERSPDYAARLPVDRAFSMRGFGAVVTGTLVAGTINEGDELEVLPKGTRVRVRGVQVHGQSVKQAHAGERTALNLGGIDTSELERGMVLAPPALLRPTQIIDAELELLTDAPRPLRSRARVRFHAGAAEALARVQVLNESGEIAPGARGLVQLRTESPVVVVGNERFIIRSYSPSRTIAGGRVLDNDAHRYRGRDARLPAHDRLLSLAHANNEETVKILVNAAGERGLRRADLLSRTGWLDSVLEHVVSDALASKSILETEGLLLSQNIFTRLLNQTVKAVKSYHKTEPLARGLVRETLRERVFAELPAEIFRSVLAQAEAAGVLVAEREFIRAREHQLTLSDEDEKLQRRFEQLYEKAGLAAPDANEALALVSSSRVSPEHARKILQLSINNGTLVRIGDFLFHKDALERLLEQLREYAKLHEPERLIDVAAFKDLTGVSRKYAIPLLEHLDRTRVTRRAGDRRIIL